MERMINATMTIVGSPRRIAGRTMLPAHALCEQRIVVGAVGEDFPGTNGLGGKPGLSGRICAPNEGKEMAGEKDAAAATAGTPHRAASMASSKQARRRAFIRVIGVTRASAEQRQTKSTFGCRKSRSTNSRRVAGRRSQTAIPWRIFCHSIPHQGLRRFAPIFQA